ncbi:hypothetical protein MPSI1_002766 [Malassezia psittaci]|uniref:Membrane anchor Opy2 N-terminal domain-containing protein n=1 Tax=Malassezia psittaci TaxID=1821823 RepID=A0AAF0JLE9_9BASI|nr:hypothetical protein MPSI1_002766 [Malassezia psittaci]
MASSESLTSSPTPTCADCPDISACPPCGEHSCPQNVCVADPSSQTAHRAVIGAAVGGCLGAILLLALLYLGYRKLKRKDRLSTDSPVCPPMPSSFLSSSPVSLPTHPLDSPNQVPPLSHISSNGSHERLIAPSSPHDLWRISESYEPPDTPHSKPVTVNGLGHVPTITGTSPNPNSASDIAPEPLFKTLVVRHSMPNTSAEVPRIPSMHPTPGTPVRNSSQSRTREVVGAGVRDSTFYTFLNEIVDEYDDADERIRYSSLSTKRETLSTPSSPYTESRLTPTVPKQLQMIKGKFDLIKRPSKLKARQSSRSSLSSQEEQFEMPATGALGLTASPEDK